VSVKVPKYWMSFRFHSYSVFSVVLNRDDSLISTSGLSEIVRDLPPSPSM
jgi:hypothetical protein